MKKFVQTRKSERNRFRPGWGRWERRSEEAGRMKGGLKAFILITPEVVEVPEVVEE